MPQLPDNYVPSWSVRVRGKARLAVKDGRLVKSRNAVHGRAHSNPQGAGLMARHCVGVLAKGLTIHCERRLVSNHQDGAEFAIFGQLGY